MKQGIPYRAYGRNEPYFEDDPLSELGIAWEWEIFVSTLWFFSSPTLRQHCQLPIKGGYRNSLDVVIQSKEKTLYTANANYGLYLGMCSWRRL